MNSKTAKLLRKAIREELGARVEQSSYQQDQRTGQVRVNGDTGKGIYKKAKKNLRDKS